MFFLAKKNMVKKGYFGNEGLASDRIRVFGIPWKCSRSYKSV